MDGPSQKPTEGRGTCLDAEGTALFNELNALLELRNPESVLLSDWLHSGEVVIPSVRLILYLGIRILQGHGISEEAGFLSRDQLASRIVQALRDESPEERKLSIRRSNDVLQATALELNQKRRGVSGYAHEWLPILQAFYYPLDRWDEGAGSPAILAGQRALARGIVESLILRAVFHFDVERIDALREAVEVIRDGRELVATNANRIAARILGCREFLETNLGYSPSKSEFRTFLLGLYPDELTDHSNEWTEAFRLLRFSELDDRKRVIDADRITRLVRQAQSLK